MKVGDLILDWYYPGFGLVIDILDKGEDMSKLVQVYFSETSTAEWRYEEELVVIGRKKGEKEESPKNDKDSS